MVNSNRKYIKQNIRFLFLIMSIYNNYQDLVQVQCGSWCRRIRDRSQFTYRVSSKRKRLENGKILPTRISLLHCIGNGGMSHSEKSR